MGIERETLDQFIQAFFRGIPAMGIERDGMAFLAISARYLCEFPQWE